MKRFVLKLSGEALAAGNKHGINDDFLDRLANVIRGIDAQLVVVVGAGNFWRGRQTDRMNKASADHMGMLATVMNSVALSDAFTRNGIPNRHFSAFAVDGVAERYSVVEAVRALQDNEVVIVSGGTGSPFFTTDSGAALRAAELRVDGILLAKNIDGVYDKDPAIHADAVKFEQIDISKAIDMRLKVMDLTAMAICMENKIDIRVFGLDRPENIASAVLGTNVGTLVTGNS
ncbi:MAG: UMP kinase [Bacillota bacterium]|nr:UMP kinase [Bacillota bacterium]